MQDVLQDIHQYNHHFTISQVVTFFERKGLVITKSMIQNYVRDGLLPPPVNKRYYTHKHLAVLSLVVKLKTVYEIAEIIKVLRPLMDSEGIPLEVYRECIRESSNVSLPQNVGVLALMAHSIDVKDEVLLQLKKI